MQDIDTLLRPLRAALVSHRDAVLQAPPGAGKSTLVPLALLREPWLAERKILLLEPRRLAARAVATRMAQLLGERVGETVGWRMRLDTRVSRATRIEVVTEGVLARMLQSDPALDGVGCVIFDEFHERSLNADLGLALALDARETLDAAFRILVMSATLDGERIAALLQAPLVDVPGRSFPVDIRYTGRGLPPLPGGPDRPEQFWLQAIRRALQEHDGDVLVFLPGAGEIRRVEQSLRESADPGSTSTRTHVLPLYGDLPADQQDAVFLPSAPGDRRVILATNIAETSVTIPGITVVVDSGLARRSLFDPGTGMSRLELRHISRSSATQRAGRAGRLAPGVCYRVWSESAHLTLPAHTPPEVVETDLAPLMLELAAWGAQDAGVLRWLDIPPAPMQQQARDLLTQLEALDAHGAITPLGRAMASLPVHPRLAHLLCRGTGTDTETLAAELAALLAERDLLRAGPGVRDPDLRTRLEALRRGAGDDVDRGALMRVRQSAERLRGQMRALRSSQARSAGGHAGSAEGGARAGDIAAAGELLLHAFPDRIGLRRAGAEGRYLLSGGRGASFRDPTGLARSEFIVVAALDDVDREAHIQLAAPVSREALLRECAPRITVRDEVRWDARSGTVLSRRGRWLGELLLDESALRDPPAEALTTAMQEGVRTLGIEALPWDRDTRNLQARMEFVRGLKRNDTGDWPASDDASLLATLTDWLAPWLEGCMRRDHLARLPLGEALRARLSQAQRQQLDALAPRDLRVPSGSHIRIDYEDDNAPCIGVRLHEVFGLAETPRIGGGAVPITFKLLSPAQRPVQITRDLAGFWRSSYAEVRKDMRGRYPRHHWPENPLEAAPTVRSIKRK